MERIFDSAEGREARLRRFGRMVALAYLIAGVAAIPANLLIEPSQPLIYAMPLIAVLPGLLWLALPWERMPGWFLHVPLLAASVGIVAATTFASIAFSAYYLFVAVFAALFFPRLRPLALHLSIIGACLAVPVFVGDAGMKSALLRAVVIAPTVGLVTMIVAYLVSRLELAGERYQALALEDELTGVGNYRALQETLGREVARHERAGRAFALILVDLDGFKDVNERLGHLEGDRVLAGVGATLREVVRGGDAVFRQGGDEFAILAPETAPLQADLLCARVARRIEAAQLSPLPIAASTGAALYPRDGADADVLLSRADAELRAKKRELYSRRSGLRSIANWPLAGSLR